ncbi:hypothetical protein FJ930_18435 [Mesorhizobium sp. B2-4-15]|uniref:hypothetical protein n=1 Tax=unclassified Mesorhizobium TaxID=325217 RepID=UPI00112D72AB|nr:MULTISPECIES: hypothetical protein [unclassified Mesorhizobium]TPK70302.1 hypothetical protein FJ930_18435 [Mesorhizobium sp. B2-4-15]TPM35855.1 hypothetical protein FJ958_03435 [Mesorhizobium sp. B2-3-5]
MLKNESFRVKAVEGNQQTVMAFTADGQFLGATKLDVAFIVAFLEASNKLEQEQTPSDKGI